MLHGRVIRPREPRSLLLLLLLLLTAAPAVLLSGAPLRTFSLPFAAAGGAAVGSGSSFGLLPRAGGFLPACLVLLVRSSIGCSDGSYSSCHEGFVWGLLLQLQHSTSTAGHNVCGSKARTAAGDARCWRRSDGIIVLLQCYQSKIVDPHGMRKSGQGLGPHDLVLEAVIIAT